MTLAAVFVRTDVVTDAQQWPVAPPGADLDHGLRLTSLSGLHRFCASGSLA
jgi:hypothetical protein